MYPKPVFSVSDPACGGNISTIFTDGCELYSVNMRGDICRLGETSPTEWADYYSANGYQWSERHNAWPSVSQRMAR